MRADLLIQSDVGLAVWTRDLSEEGKSAPIMLLSEKTGIINNELLNKAVIKCFPLSLSSAGWGGQTT